MNKTWAEAKLVEYLGLCDSVKRAVPPGEHWNETARGFNEQAELMLATVEKILKAIDPSDTDKLLPPSYSSENGEGRVRKALGALRQQEEVEKQLSPDSPEFLADRLHPTVWKAASVTWNTGQYRVAVGQAALALATQIKARSKSKLTDRKLVQDVFAPDPPKAGSVRLQFPGDVGDDTWKSRQQGLHLLAQGVYAGIRNVSVHDETDWPEHEALEYLAVLSVVGRWFDATEPVEG